MAGKQKRSAKKGKSKTEQMRELREKNAAAQSAKPPKGKKTKAEGKDKKPKAGKLEVVGTLVPTIDPSVLKQLQQDAAAGEKELESSIPEYIAKGAQIYNVMDDFKKRELWKFAPTPYKSWTAFVEHYAKLAQVSTRTLFGVIGATKALPGVSAEVKKKIGPRKLQKVARAVKTIKKKTQNEEAELPPEIIQKATEQSEEEFDTTLREAGLVDEPLPPPLQTAPMFDTIPGDPSESMRQSRVSVTPDAPVEVHSGDPARHGIVDTDSVTGSKIVDRAITVAIQVYDPSMTIDQALEFVCKMWLKSTCDREEYDDMTNDAAADEIAKAKKNGRNKR